MIDIYYSKEGANTFIVYNENNEGFLVDPGFSPNGELINHIKKLNKDIKAILITHGHFDHIHSLQKVCELYPNAIVYISSEEKIFLTDKRYNLSNSSIGVINYEPKHLIEVTDNEIIEVAGFKVKVIATPFHTIGSVCYYLESEKALFSGDTLFYMTIGRTDLPTGTTRTLESSLSKLKALPDGIKVYPGHASCTSLDREKKYNTYLKNI